MSVAGTMFHGVMLNDRARNETLAAAVERTVRPGDVVVDVGAGVGLLSLLAARAGARRVYALEEGPIARLAVELAQRNGFGDVVVVERVRSQEWSPPERADVVLCETLGYALLEEGLRASIADARRRMLRPGGRLVPQAVRLLAAPVDASDLPIDTGYLDSLLGFDLAPLGALYRRVWQRHHVSESDELAPPQVALSLDCRTLSPDEALETTLQFTCRRGGTLTAFVLWFEADLAADVLLSSRSPDPRNHWGQVVLPAGRPGAVAAGDRIGLRLGLNDARGLRMTWEQTGRLAEQQAVVS